MSDVPFYHDVVKKGMLGGFSAYCDFWFPYPPLSLPLIYLPGFVSTDYNRYRDFFRYEMLVFDAVAFVLLWMFLARRLKAPRWAVSGALTVYSGIGLAVGHLLLDRLDIFLTGCFIGAVHFYTGESRRRWLAYPFLLAGALLKLVPLFLLPMFGILEMYRRRGDVWPDRLRFLIPFAAVALPFAATLMAWETNVCDAVFRSLSEHGVRGVQIESNWALPLLGGKILRANEVFTDFSYGAFHLYGRGVPEWYVWLAKNVGMAVLLAYFVVVSRWFRLRVADPSRLPPDGVMILMYGVLLLIISTQRVLSPQFMIWLMPLVAVQFATARRRFLVIAGAFVVYSLSWRVFDVGFRRILDFDPASTFILAARNMVLLVWTVDVIRLGYGFIRRQRRTALPELA